MLVHYQVKPVAFCFGSPVFDEFAVVKNKLQCSPSGQIFFLVSFSYKENPILIGLFNKI
jgi:hypothetical protein